jgi:hypothetical protein
MRIPRRWLVPVLVLAVCLQIAACRYDAPFDSDRGAVARVAAPYSNAADPENPGQYFPLSELNLWAYETKTLVVTSEEGSPPETTQVTETEIRQIVNRFQIGNDTYYEERSTVQGHPESAFSIYLRQDGSGLYERESAFAVASHPRDAERMAATEANPRSPQQDAHVLEQLGRTMEAAIAKSRHPAAMRAAWMETRTKIEALWGTRATTSSGGVGLRARPEGVTEELQRLRYPLRLGQSWIIRQSPLFTAAVDGVGTFSAHKGSVPTRSIRIRSELFAPEDVVHQDVSPIGFTGLHARLNSQGTDENGNFTVMKAEVDSHLIHYLVFGKGRS